MLLSTAREEVRARLQELVADFWTEDEVTRAINEGVNRFSQEEKWPWLFTIRDDNSLSAGWPFLDLEDGVAFERHFNVLLTFAGEDRPRSPRRVSATEGYLLRQQFYTDQSEPMAYYISSVLDTGNNDIQYVLNAGDTAGNFTLDLDGETTASIPRGASYQTIQDALIALPNVGPADLRCWGGPLGTDYVRIMFQRNLGSANISLMTLGGTTTDMTCDKLQVGGGGSGEFVYQVRFVPGLNRDATVEYQYIRDPQEVNSETDTLDIPNEYVMGVVAYATGHLFLKELNTSNKAAEQFELYRKSVDQAKLQLRKLTTDSGFAWGRNEPEPQYITELEYAELITPPTLGP